MELRAGYKHTEVGVIPEDWEVKKLKDLSFLITKGTTPQKFSDSGINFIRIECLSWDEINIDKCLFINEKTHKSELKRSILNEHDLLFAIAGATIGKCTIVPQSIIPANTNQALAIIRLKENINIHFVYCFLKSALMQKYVIDNISGGAQPNLNLKQLGNFSFPLPATIAEQTAIATALSDTDNLIRGLEKLIEKKRAIKQGAMQELLQPKEGWEVKKIRDIIITIIDNRGKTPPYTKNDSIELIETNAISFTLKYPEYTKISKYVSETVFKKWFRGHPQKNDLLVSTVGEYSGATAIMEYDRGTIAQNLISLRINNNEVDSHFVFYWSRSQYYQNQIKQVMMNQAQPSLRVPWLINFEISFPENKQEQTRIASILSDMDEEIGGLEVKLEKYKQVKMGMMQELLTGKIRLV